ncbi:hypothetical protein AAHE18_03G158700 [Arachis hypogaea]
MVVQRFRRRGSGLAGGNGQWQQLQGLQEGADATQQRRDQLALSQIHQGVDYTVFGKIANAKSAKEALSTLKLSFKGIDKAQKAKLQSLRREYERYEMSSSETVEQYFTQSHDMDAITIAELQGTMKSHISRILKKSEKSTEEALKNRVNLNNIVASSHTKEGRGRGFNFQSRGRGSFRGRGRGNYNQGSYNNFTPPNQERGRGRGNFYQERTNFNCFHCGKYAHKAADCRFKMVNNNQAHVAENQHQNTDDNPGIQTLFFTSNSCAEDANIWYLDNACSNHMSGRKELFSSLNDSVKPLLKFGNSTKIPIEGKRHIPIRLKDGSLSYISDIFYAPELDYNLLSMEQLSEKGYKMITYHGYCTVFNSNGSKNQKHVMSLRHSRRLSKNKVATKSKFSEQTEEQNILHVQNTLSNTEFNIN